MLQVHGELRNVQTGGATPNAREKPPEKELNCAFAKREGVTIAEPELQRYWGKYPRLITVSSTRTNLRLFKRPTTTRLHVFNAPHCELQMSMT